MTRRSRLGALAIGALAIAAWALLLAPRPARGKAPDTGAALLLQGPKALTERLGAELDRWRARHPEVVGPRAARRRLASEPAAVRSLQTAGAAVEAAEDALLRMKRDTALSAARRARAALEAVDGRHFAASLLARAHLAEGAALLLHPADPARALDTFRKAFSLDPDHRPDPDRVPTRMAGLLRRARASAPPPRPPTGEELASLSARLAVARLVWVTTRRRDGQVAATLMLYDPNWQKMVRSKRAVWPLQPAPRHLAAELDTLLGDGGRPAGPSLQPDLAEVARVPGSASPSVDTVSPLGVGGAGASGHGGQQTVSRARPTVSRARPWFKRWWVWAVAGAVVAGSAVAIAAAAGSETERSYEFRFNH